MQKTWAKAFQETRYKIAHTAQQREVKDSIQHLDTTIRDRLQEACSWLIVPMQDGTNLVTLNVFWSC